MGRLPTFRVQEKILQGAWDVLLTLVETLVISFRFFFCCEDNLLLHTVELMDIGSEDGLIHSHLEEECPQESNPHGHFPQKGSSQRAPQAKLNGIQHLILLVSY